MPRGVWNPFFKGQVKDDGPKDYTVVKIEGEYAYLRPDHGTEADDLFIALALLPPEADIGTRLHYEMLCYTVIE